MVFIDIVVFYIKNKKKITPPPFNIFTNKIMHIYHRPRLFANDDNLNRSSDKQNPNMLPGWSFVNNEES